MMKYLSDTNWWKQTSLKVGGFLTSVLGALSLLNIHFEWLTANSINAVVSIIGAFGVFFVGCLATLINTYLTDRSKQEAKAIADDYVSKQLAAEQAEIDKIKEAVAQIQAEKEAKVENPQA
ncbi:hypothetical protein [Heyndrickxia acidicola]|uniref:Holin n=1 Tax=Heyndrickxia acidicola TaxID=209389 RepID=A0ABU6MQE2_9BACI|nr:hypothetical protein [Heyndrickxia acidicola]MED1205858.1 hypothetical protein [Heyndrickxia acidicola]